MRRRASSGSKSVTVVPSSTLPEAGDRPGGEEQRLGEGGLARPAVADQGDVADLLRRERLGRHRHPPGQRRHGVRGESTQDRPAPPGAAAGSLGARSGTGRCSPGVPIAHRSAPLPTEDSLRMLDGRWRATVERGLEPVGQGLHRAGITADGLTIIGLVFAVGTAFADRRRPPRCSACSASILTGLPDILDGSVARQSGRASPRGAFFDSVCDRVADAALFIGVAWYLAETEHARYAGARDGGARAARCSSPTSGPGPSRSASTARGGLMERAERLVLLGVGLAFDILVPVLWVMLVLTALHRGPAVREGVAPGHARAAAAARVTTAARAPRSPAPAALAQWWAAHRPQTERAGRSGSASPSPLTRPRRTALPALPEAHAVLRVPRRCRDRPRSCPSRSGAPLAREAGGQVGARVHAERRRPGRAQPAPRARAAASAAPSCGGRSTATFESYGRYCYELFRLPDRTSPQWIDGALRAASGIEHIAAGRRRGHGRGARAAAPRQLGLRRRVARGPGLHGHRGRRAGRAARAVRVVRRDACARSGCG